MYVVAVAGTWRTRLLRGAALTFCFVLPVLGHMRYSAVILHYGFELSRMGDASLYGRTAHAADCVTLRVPGVERPLCPTAPVAAAAAAVRLQRAAAAAPAGELAVARTGQVT